MRRTFEENGNRKHVSNKLCGQLDGGEEGWVLDFDVGVLGFYKKVWNFGALTGLVW